jgi:hypothetical protein
VGDVLRLPTRHPAYRRREGQSGSSRLLKNAIYATALM